MATSAMKSLLNMRELPFPPLLLITDEVNLSSAADVVQVLLDNFLADGGYLINCVHGNCFSDLLTESDTVIHYRQTFSQYGVDPTAFDNFMSSYRETHPRKPQVSIPRLTKVSSEILTSGKIPEQEIDVSQALTEKNNFKKSTEKKTLVLVDRVEDILLYTSARHFLLSCREITEDGGIVILVCSATLVAPSVLQRMRCAASSVVSLTSAENSSNLTHWQGIAEVLIHRPTGKLVKTREFYHIDVQSHSISAAVAPPPSSHAFSAVAATDIETKEFILPRTNHNSLTGNPATENWPNQTSGNKGAPKISLKSSNLAHDKEETPSMTKPECNSEGDREEQAINTLVSQATFSLRLSDKEREAKNNLLLPHQRVLHLSERGVIHYTPDSEDWDEEDPDDDLDI